jgi:cardiolipin synthase A/B
MGRPLAPRAVRCLECAAAVFLAALLLASSPSAARETETLPSPPFAPAPFLGPTAPVLVSRVYANAARDDEFVEIANVGAIPVDLAGWALTDREATETFPLDTILPAGGRVVVTRNATSYEEDLLATADFASESGNVRRMGGGILRLADAGDEILLLDPNGAVVDAYVWGGSSYDGPGWTDRPAVRTGRGEIAVRQADGTGRWSDTDSAEDWEGLRQYRLGQSSFDLEPFDLRGPVAAVLSPDDGDGLLLGFLRSAATTIEVGVYTLTGDRIASVLAEAAHRGVRVRILLDGGPVGGIEEDEHRIVGGLLASGAEVRWLKGGSDVVKRYRYLHAKYAIVDATAAWIGSENFGDAGFAAQRDGNRGWSVLLGDVELARALREVFEQDFDARRRDTIPAIEPIGGPLQAPPPTSFPPAATPSAGRAARLVIGPDATLHPDGLLDVIAAARERLSIEAFYLEDDWGNKSNPFLEAAFGAARRGVTVHVLLDGSWSSVAEVGSNDDVLERVNRRAREEGVPLEVRLLEPQGPIKRLHNKGAMADGRVVLVSSMNWAFGSATENREIGVILEDPELARRFESAFDADWEGRATSGVESWRIDDPVVLVGVYGFVVAASAVSLRKLRVGAKGINGRPRVRTRASLRADLRGRRGEVRLLPPQLVAESRPRSGGRAGARAGRAASRRRVRGPEGH